MRRRDKQPGRTEWTIVALAGAGVSVDLHLSANEAKAYPLGRDVDIEFTPRRSKVVE